MTPINELRGRVSQRQRKRARGGRHWMGEARKLYAAAEIGMATAHMTTGNFDGLKPRIAYTPGRPKGQGHD